jgi:hypothetical protein
MNAPSYTTLSLYESKYYALDIFIPNQKSQWAYLQCHVYLHIDWNISPLIHFLKRIFSCGSFNTLLSIVARLWTEWTRSWGSKRKILSCPASHSVDTRVKQLRCDPNHSATLTAKVTKAWNSISNPPYILWCSA